MDQEVVNEVVPYQGGQVSQGEQVPIANRKNKVLLVPMDMSNEEVRGDSLTLAWSTTTQADIEVGPRVNALESTMTSRLRDFGKTNPPTILWSKVGEDPQAFLDEV